MKLNRLLWIITFVMGVGVLCLVSFTRLSAETLPADENPNVVKMTWEEFKKLLKLDADEIELSWNEFKKLLALTGTEIKVEYDIQNGKVVLQREQFKKLLEQMKPPIITPLSPPGDYLITKAVYAGSMDKKSTMFTVRFYIEIFDKKRDAYPKIQLLPQVVAIREIKLDDKPALIMVENDWYVLTTDKVGQHIIDVQFSVKSDLDKGPAIMDLAIPKTAITLFKLDIPLKDIQVEIPQEKYMTVSTAGNRTKVDAVLSSTERINVTLHRVSPADIIKRGPAKVYAETMNLLSVEDDVIRVTTKFKLDILQNTIADIRVYVPEGYSILHVRDQNQQEIRDWSTIQEKDREILIVPFGGKKEGTVIFTVIAEKIFSEEDDSVAFNGFQVVKAVRETGFVGIEKKSTAETEILETDNIDVIDMQRLPSELVNMSTRPLIFALRYLRHPHQVSLTITKHEELAVVNTVIDNASVVSVFLEDGKIITRVVYTIRNTGKQFLEMTLPEDAEIWSLYVDGQRELPAKDDQGNFMIPLVLSKIQNGNIVAFDVEIVYYMRMKRFACMGSERLLFPQTDIIISTMLWSCYFPVDYRFVHFGGNVEKEKIASGFHPLLGGSRVFTYDEVSEYSKALENWESASTEVADDKIIEVQKRLKSEFRTGAHNELDAITNQLRQEIDFAEKIQKEREHGAIGTPLLRIDIPTSGQLYRFAKTLVEGEELYIEYYYVSDWLNTTCKVILIALVCFVVYIVRNQIIKMYISVIRWIESHRAVVKKCKTPQGTRVLLIAGAIISLFISKFLFVVFVLLLLLTWLKPEWIFRNKEKNVEQKESSVGT
jgi:hypothetical protein